MEKEEPGEDIEYKRFEYENQQIRKKAILKVLNIKIDNYIPSIVFITEFQIKKFYEICANKVKHKSYNFIIDYSKPYELVLFVFFLTKKQIKENQKARKKRIKHTITFSGEQFKKTCLKSLDLHQKIEYILNYKLLSSEKKVEALWQLFYLQNDLMNVDNIKDKKEIIKEINKLNQKLNQKHIPLPKNLSKLPPIKLKITKNTTVDRHYADYLNIDNTTKKNTNKNIQIKNWQINLPKVRPKKDIKRFQKIRDKDNAENDSSDWDSDSSEAKKNYEKLDENILQKAYLKFLKKTNAKKAKQLKSLKSKQGKINLDTVVKNTLKKYKEPKPKKKKSIWDVIDLPKPLVI